MTTLRRAIYWLITLTLTQVIVQCHEIEVNETDIRKDLGEAFNKAKQEVRDEQKQDKEKIELGIDQRTSGTADDQLFMFGMPEAKTLKLAKAANIQLKTLKELVHAEHIDPYRLKVGKKILRLWKKKFKIYCPSTYSGLPCSPDTIYRSADGTCNNIDNPTWGAKLCPQHREIPPMYDDGINDPRQRNKWGLPLPSARVISNIVHKHIGKTPRNNKLTVMVMQWGQFIDHEFVFTPLLKGEMGANIQCCGKENENRSQCFPIMIPKNDPYYNRSCMNFVRSAPVPNHNCDPGFREQMNQVTSYIDGSAVYGSSEGEMNDLRTLTGGRMKTIDNKNKLLPKNNPSKCVLESPLDFCQKAGDGRANVVPSLGLSHTTFVREHNRIAEELARLNPHWNDETIFQETRRIIWAVLQHINYAEYLPSIFNEKTIKNYRLKVRKAYNKCYRKKVNPTISNVFAVAAFRFGHSQIPDYQATMTKNYTFSTKKDISLVYHKPHMLIADGGKAADGLARWLIEDDTPLADGLFGDGTRNKLFMDKARISLDLPALNIQRGRDHGIPGYNHWRVHCKLPKAEMTKNGSFLLPNHTQEEIHKLQLAYQHVDDIDLFTGAMTEILLPNSSVGPTFECLLGGQFFRLKHGDRYWYENPDPAFRFTPAQLFELKKVSLAAVLCNNYDITKIQPDVFHVPGPNNVRIPCEDIPQIDLSKWTACKVSRRWNNRPDFYKKYCKKNV